MPDGTDTPTEIDLFVAAMQEFNDTLHTEIRESVYSFSETMDDISRLISIPGYINLGSTGLSTLMLGGERLMDKLDFTGLEASFRGGRRSVSEFGEKARQIDSFLQGRIIIGPAAPKVPDATTLSKIKTLMKDTALGGRENELNTPFGIKDIVFYTRLVLKDLKQDFGITKEDVDLLEARALLLQSVERTYYSLAQVTPPQRASALETIAGRLEVQNTIAPLSRGRLEFHLSEMEPIADAIRTVQSILAAKDALFEDAERFATTLLGLIADLESVQAAIAWVNDAYNEAEPYINAISWLISGAIKALNWVIEQTGIVGFFEDLISDLVTELLGLDFIDEVKEFFDGFFDNDLFEVLYIVLNPLELMFTDIKEDQLVPNFNAYTKTATDGDDLLLGEAHSDTLNGGAGDDVLVGGAGIDVLIGGSGRDIALFTGGIDDYYIARLPNTDFWVVSQNRPDASGFDGGADYITGIEDLVFADEVLSIDEITGQFARSGSADGTSAILLGTPLKDRLEGGVGYDLIYGRADDDIIYTVANGELTVTSNTPNPIQRRGDDANGEAGDDLLIVGSLYDNIDGGPGKDTASFRDTFDYGLNLSLAGASDITLYHPADTSVLYFDMLGTGRPGLTQTFVSTLYRIEEIYGTNYGDVIFGNAEANTLRGLDGNDTLRGLGGDDTLYGGIGNDLILGDRGTDSAYGDEGLDLFVGGLGDDFFDGGPDRDAVLYSVEVDVPEGGSFQLFSDRLDRIAFDSTGPANQDLPYTIRIETQSATSSAAANLTVVQKYDINGNTLSTDYLKSVSNIYGTAQGDHVEASSNTPQTIYGGGGDDSIYAGAIDDIDETGTGAYGGSGNDTFYGNTGGDFFSGGEGDDFVPIIGARRIGDNDIYSGGADFDTIDLSASAYPWHIFFDLERNNTFVGGLRPDLGSADQEQLFIDRTVGNSFDLKRPTDLSLLSGGRAQVQSFEQFIGSNFSDVISVGSPFDPGDPANDLIRAYGGLGNDVLFGAQTGGKLYGEAGADIMGTYNHTFGLGGFLEQFSLYRDDIVTTLDGGVGNDIFIAGDAREVFIGGADDDTLRYRDSTSGVTVNLATGTASGGYAEGDAISGIEWLEGSDHNDHLTGHAGENRLFGWGGDDTLIGAELSDFLEGGEGADSVDGNGGIDQINGGSENDTLNGGAGDDALSGDAGDDELWGGAGDDLMIAGTGNDYLDGGADYDIVQYAGFAADYTVINQGAFVTVSYDGYTDQLFNVENVQFDDLTLDVSLMPVGANAANTMPTGTITLSGTPVRGETLTGEVTALADGQGILFNTFSLNWTRDGVDIEGAAFETYTLVTEDVGSVIALAASFEDGGGTIETVLSQPTPVITSINTAPTGMVTLSGTALQGETLTAETATLADADGLGAFAYEWRRDQEVISQADASTYILTQSDVGKIITVEVNYVDGLGTAETIRSAPSDPVANRSDPVEGILRIEGTATVGARLSADVSDITDLDGINTSTEVFQWLRDGVAIEAATAQTYDLVEADRETAISLRYAFTDFGGDNEQVISAPTSLVTGENRPVEGSLTLTGAVKEGSLLIADTSGISDPDGLGTFGFAWLRDGMAIGGAEDGSYLLTLADVGATIAARVRYTDDGGTIETVVSAATLPVIGLNTPVEGTPTISGTAAQGSLLTADTANLVDADGLGDFEYVWERDGTPIAGADNSTYLLTSADVGTEVSVMVRFTDARGTVESSTSTSTAPVLNVNDAPTGEVLITGTLRQGESLGSDVSSLDDPDGIGDQPLAFQWRANDLDIPGATGTTLQLTQSEVGREITLVITYTDAGGTVEKVESQPTASVLNLNDLPEGALEILGVAAEYEVLTANLDGVSDADDFDSSVVEVQWLREGEVIAGETDLTYVATEDDIGKSIGLRMTYLDGAGTLEEIESLETQAIVATSVTRLGTDQPDLLQGGGGADSLFGLERDDVLRGSGGDDLLEGGDGRDTALFSGPRAAYTISLSASGTRVEDRRGTDGTDLLDSIEALDFIDQDWSLALFDNVTGLSDEEFSTFVEMYIAYFNRAPDAEGLFFWGNALSNGVALETIAELFFDQPETRATYPDLSDLEAFARTVYENVLGRVSDEGGLNFWVDVLERGAVSLGTFMLSVLRGAKAAADPGQSQEFIAQKAADVAYLEAKTDLGAYFSVHKGMSDTANATAALRLFDGSDASFAQSKAAIDDFYIDAVDAEAGEFLIQLVGVVDNPFEAGVSI